MALLGPELLSALAEHEVIILCGWPGSGKSTLAEELVSEFEALRLSSDIMRERLFQSERYAPDSHAQVQQWSEQVYELMYQEAASEAMLGRRVIIDATHLHTEKRLANLEILLLQLLPHQVCYLLMNTPSEQIAERMLALPDLAAGWQRVTGFFQNDEEQGLISWPNEDREGVKVYEVYSR